MKEYNFKEVEEKWQKRWVEEKSFRAIDFHPTKPKYYVMYEFYNISGNLHMGHLKGTVPADALARYKRLNNFNVLFPIGGDAFGLPAENAAIKNHIKPNDFVKDGMQKVIDQSKKIGLSFDWDRTICTSDPDYYKWTQWIFLQLLKNNKAYKEKGKVNYCPNCKTVLSNEDSQNGVCDRCGGNVEQVERSIWFLKMREYSEKLLGNVDRIKMSEHLKEAQRNWIGRSEGVTVKFKVVDDANNEINEVEIFTTCVETIYGVTFLTLAPENSIIDILEEKIANYNEITDYREIVKHKTDLDRMSSVDTKSGVELKGVYAVNPVTGKRVPIFTADFVLAHYGTGAVMAVPAHDQRDYDFACAHNLPIIQVIEGDVSNSAVEKHEYIKNNSKMMNSGKYDGQAVMDAKKNITNLVCDNKFGKKTVNYKMLDWPFNRQRYWGEPFPVVFCDKCGVVPLPESELPLILPATDDYLPCDKGDSPLAKIDNWVNCKCPCCGGIAKRETDTMPNWAGSSWYWLRYVDPHNPDKLADFEKLKYWGSVDMYTGGTEHITRHVLYAFFWQNFLYEIGVVPTRDPFICKMGSGLVLDDTGKKMSKSSTNGVSPSEVINQYGADVARLHLHFLSGYEDNSPWTYKGIDGIITFLNRVWNLQDIINGEEISKGHEIALYQLNKKVSSDIEHLSLNTAIAALMSFIKVIRKDGYISREELRQFLIILNPLAPHITSEMYEIQFGRNIIEDSWPEVDEECLEGELVDIPCQINGKLALVVSAKKNSSKEEIIALINKKKPDITDCYKKIVFVPNKIINIIK